ncbi:DUF2586 domain-containing protein [uncultured Microbulbifer sp.]|uniref:DUF2586 domain-containing protein n=1 Tax=uncultured Microbulbifer sp. TaxID=348147 RepID=UPI00263688E7|nr:DUF2586 domain-containing protein [uncultured Microbulbifer sp.]
MALGKVAVNNLNQAQGSTPEIERKALIIGEGATNTGQLISLNSQSDIDTLLGEDSSEIRDNVLAAQLNGGENWQAWAAPQANGYDWAEVVDTAMATVSPELIALCTPATTSGELTAMYTKAESLRTSLARRVIIITATPGIDDSSQTWSDYEAAQAAITNGVAGYRVGVVPQLHGNNLGVLAGRLCNHAVSTADSPMRVATGPLIGLGDTPIDNAGTELTAATLETLDTARLSVPQTYPDYPGTYWGDCNLLDIPGGDYQVIEHLRVVDKAARAVRLLAIAKVANRSLNSTPASINANKTDLMRPLREMSYSTVFAGQHFPGEIKPPTDDSITIVWPSNSAVEIYIKVQPYNSPKAITANIILDISGR